MFGRNRTKPAAGHWSAGPLVTLAVDLDDSGELRSAHVSLVRPGREDLHESWTYGDDQDHRQLAGTGLSVSRMVVEAVEQYRWMAACGVLVVHGAPAVIGAVRADLAVRECEPWIPQLHVIDVAVIDAHMLGYRPTMRPLGAIADAYGVQCSITASAPVRRAELLAGCVLAVNGVSGDVSCLSAGELVTAQTAWVGECVDAPIAWPYERASVTQAQVRPVLSLRNLFS